MEQHRTPFISHQTGFKFINRFDFPDFFELKLPFMRFAPISLGEVVYGLCGGMCFAALDYFNVPKPIPILTNVDEIPLKLFYYLWERQLDSLSADAVHKVFKWMVLDDNTLARVVNQWEIPKLRSQIDAAKPVPLALVRTKGISDPTKNHQVIVNGYDFEPATYDMKLYLYDPNHPGEQPTLSMNLSKPSKGLELSQSTGEPIRGFFSLDYEPQSPP
jgi:hypothetical protein